MKNNTLSIDKSPQDCEPRLYAYCNLSLEDVQYFVCNHFRVSIEQLRCSKRKRTFVRARHAFAWLAYHFTKYSVSEIANHLQRDHTSIMYGRDTVAESLDINDNYFGDDIQLLKANCHAKAHAPSYDKDCLRVASITPVRSLYQTTYSTVPFFA